MISHCGERDDKANAALQRLWLGLPLDTVVIFVVRARGVPAMFHNIGWYPLAVLLAALTQRRSGTDSS
jgi:hypothetical protein